MDERARAIALVGATGVLGALVAGRLEAAGVPVVAWDPRRASVCPALTVIDASSPGAGGPVRAAAARAGAVYLGARRNWSHDALREAEVAARAAEATVVPFLGHDAVTGTAGAVIAATARQQTASGPLHVHTSHLLVGLSPRWRVLSPGLRLAARRALTGPVSVIVDGQTGEDRVAEARRLGWFPRPVGARHAAAIPAVEPLVLSRHLDHLHTARSYLALGSSATEVLQATALLRSGRAAPVRGRRVRWGVGAGTETVRVRWATVSEAAIDPGPPVRVWANGTDPYDLTAWCLVGAAAIASERRAAGDLPAGVLDPLQLWGPQAWLDAAADAGLLRWNTIRPDPEPG